MTGERVVNFENLKVACRNCSLMALCLPKGLAPEDMDSLDSIVRRNRPLHRGDHLFREGDSLRCLYVVKTGSVKGYAPCDDGSEHVLGFHLPGELMGLDAIESNHHHCSAKVLETSAVCEIPFSDLEALSSKIPSLQHQMFRLLSREISHDEDMLSLLGKRSADERLCAFLLSLSERYKNRGFSATDFYLSMSRHEIACYLGLAVETVSRLFTRFQEEGLLKVERKHIQLLAPDRLKNLVHGENTKVDSRQQSNRSSSWGSTT